MADCVEGRQFRGAWACNICHASGCWPTKSRCFRCGNPGDSHSSASASGPASPAGREKAYPGRASKPKPAPVNPTVRVGTVCKPSPLAVGGVPREPSEKKRRALEEEFRAIKDGMLSPNATPAVVSVNEPVETVDQDPMNEEIPPMPLAEGQATVNNVPGPLQYEQVQGVKGKRLRTSDSGTIVHGVFGHDSELFGQHIALCAEAELQMYMKENSEEAGSY